MTTAILTAAGVGSRLGQDVPKQFLTINDKPLIIYTLEQFQKHPEIDSICVVCLPGWEEVLKANARQFGIDKLKWVIPGGETGMQSIQNAVFGLENELKDDDLIIIQDGIRVNTSQEIISECLKTTREKGNAIAAVPIAEAPFYLKTKDDKKTDIKDDIKDDDKQAAAPTLSPEQNQSIKQTSPEVQDTDKALSQDKIRGEDNTGRAVAPNPNQYIELDRSRLLRTQTPHGIHYGLLKDLHKQAIEKGIKDTVATCNLLSQLGYDIHFFPGSDVNLKITTEDDIKIFQALLNLEKLTWENK